MAGWLYPLFIYCLSALDPPFVSSLTMEMDPVGISPWQLARCFPIGRHSRDTAGGRISLPGSGLLLWGPTHGLCRNPCNRHPLAFTPIKLQKQILCESQKCPRSCLPSTGPSAPQKSVSHLWWTAAGPRWPSRHFSTIHTFSQYSLNFSLSSPWIFSLGPHVFLTPLELISWYN